MFISSSCVDLHYNFRIKLEPNWFGRQLLAVTHLIPLIQLNVGVPGYLAELARAIDFTLVYISTGEQRTAAVMNLLPFNDTMDRLCLRRKITSPWRVHARVAY